LIDALNVKAPKKKGFSVYLFVKLCVIFFHDILETEFEK